LYNQNPISLELVFGVGDLGAGERKMNNEPGRGSRLTDEESGLIRGDVKFRIGKEIGRGGFCMVHECVALDDKGEPIGEPMAIKRIRDDLHEPADVMEEIRHRFEREARLLDDVLEHENIVDVLHRNLSGDQPFFIMPLADCNVWSEIEDRAGDEDWACWVFRQILEGLAYAHGKGVIHRDIKPENALVLGELIAMSDLGLGKNLSGGTAGLTKTMSGAGTEAYMAPEQFTEMKDTGPTADVFALGKLLMAFLDGEHPVVGIPDVSDLPERFRYFVSRCCEQKPENRFSDAQEALDVFLRVVEDTGFAQSPEQALDRLTEAWLATPIDEDLRVVKQIDELLRSNAHEEAVYTREIPRLPEDLLNQYMDELPDAFLEMLKIYDGHVSGGLPFEYCDTVADFYSRIYQRLDRLDVRKLILCRLFAMGRTHNRWHVRQVAMRLLKEVSNPSTVAMAAEVIRGQPDDAAWIGERYGEYSLPQPVVEAFAEAIPKPRAGEHDIPF
jgi:serine/threonine protein kinase